jgi:hypothetical protein
MSETGTKDPKVKRWLPLGILLATVCPSLLGIYHPVDRLHRDLFHGLVGVLSGIGIGILIMLIARMSRQRRAGGA